MKQQTAWYAPLGLMAAAIVGYAFFYNPPPYLTASIDANNVATFAVYDLPTLSDTGAGIRIFLSHGDGTYFMGSVAEFATHTHTYQAGNYSAFAEVVVTYDDQDEPPKRTGAINVQASSNTAVPSPPVPLANGKKILLNRTTNAVPGDSITYIITYEHDGRCSDGTLSGSVKFTYDNTLLDFGQPDLFSETAGNTTATGSATTKEYTFSNLNPGGQRSFFVRLKTEETAAVDAAMSPAPHVELILNGAITGRKCDMDTFVSRDTIVGQQIAAAHDPNFKTVLKNDLCQGDFVTWRIDFQNLGNAPTDSVVISDWIDTLFEYNSVTVLNAQSKFSVVPSAYNPAAREWRFKMAPINLRGLGERGVSEEATKGHVVFQVKKRDHIPCNAAANAARIFFGYNPPVFTSTVLAAYPCDTLNCAPCDTTELLLPPRTIIAGDSLNILSDLPASLDGFSGSDWNFKWYPTDGLDNPFVLTPTLTKAVYRTYTLVASTTSDSCQQVVVTVPVRPAAQLNMTVGTPCDKNLWSINAQATGRPPTNLVWNYGSAGTASWSRPNLSGSQTVYVAVWDTQTDQYVEKWVALPFNCPSKKPFPVWPLVALAVVVMGLALWYFLFKKP